MRLISYTKNGTPSFGLLSGDGVIDLGRRLPAADLAHALTDLAAIAKFEGEAPDVPLAEVELLPPIPAPGKIICVGLNYRTHIQETGREAPKYPMIFPRYPDSLVGAEAALVRPKASQQFDYEGELAVVIGRAGRAIAPSAALDHVAGYACFNDGSIRDFQRHTTQFMPGKNFTASGSFGPWLVTRDEVGAIDGLRLQTRLNGQVVQDTTLGDLLFGVEDLIAYVSQIFELQPGDVIATGTTGGVGAMRDPPLWMKPGDVVEVEIDRLGLLRNAIKDEA